MKMIFGFVGILVVLAIVASLAKTQLKLAQRVVAVGGAASWTPAMAITMPRRRPRVTRHARAAHRTRLSGAMAAERLNVQQQSIRIQNQVREAVNRESADRAPSARRSRVG